MNLQPEDFWSFSEWFLRPDAFLESAALKGIVLFVLAVVIGLIVGYVISSSRYGSGEGFYAVARAVRDMFREDLPRTSPRRVVALARLAFKEALRRKVLYVVGLFVVTLLLAGWYLNPQSDDPSRLYISFVLTATNYLVLALALFISSFSLPEDIKNKTIYTIVTKPVRSTEIVLGRMLGFIAMGTVILVPMGAVSYVFVDRGLRHAHYEAVELQELPGGGFEGETDYVQSHSHTFSIDENGVGVTDRVRGHQHLVQRSEDGTFTFGKPTGALRARVPSYGELVFRDRAGNLKEEGIDVGNERLAGGYGSAGIARLVGVAQGTRKVVHGYIEGGTLGTAEFTFSNVTRDRYPDHIPIDLSLRAYRSFKGDIETPIRGSLTLRHPDNARDLEFDPVPFYVDEYDLDEKRLPIEIQRSVEVEDENGNTRQETITLNVFDDLVDENNRLKVVLRCLDRSQYLGVTQSSVYLRPTETPFAWNFFKAYASIWLQMSMVTAFGVMFSTFLTGPVAMIATFVCVLLGFSAEQVYDT
ncbi:MAG: ABC transporter permease, partial [Planctomycetota bacterium]